MACDADVIRDSDTESQDESATDPDTSDTDVSDSDISDISLDNFKNESCSKYYKGLTLPQKQAYLQLCNLFANKTNTVVTINARSGTGKTFLLTALSKAYANSVKYITFRRDQASEIKLKLNDFASTYTFISFYINCLHLHYFRALQLFTANEVNDVDMLYKLILYSKKYLNTGEKIIIVDSCTLPSATMLLLLYIISLKHSMHLIFAGNKLQLSSMHKSSVHNRCNFDIIKLLSDVTIRKLSNKRSFDKTLTSKISQFCRMIQHDRAKNEVPFHFNLRYYLYTCFRSKYFVEEHFNVIYMAQFHQNITNRVYRFIDHLKVSKVKYFVAPFYYELSGTLQRITTKQKGKFFPGLVFAEGYKYIHIDEYGVHSAVLLEKINSKDGINVDSLQVRFLETNLTNTVYRCELNYYQILPALRYWLSSTVKIPNSDAKLYQFPLRSYTLTYHAALGKTINKENVELSADCSSANTIYVGLCCIRNYDDIRKIHADEDLPSFVLTDYMRKERKDEKYYYRCPSTIHDCDKEKIMRYVLKKGPNNFIDNIKWYTVSVIQDFERKKLTYYARIPRSAYEKPKKKSETKSDTCLMKIADFIKHNPKVVLNIMEKAPCEDTDKCLYNNNKKKNLEYRKANAYISLKKEYINWIGKEE